MTDQEVCEEIPEEIKAMSFEDALNELDEIIRNLEEGTNKLDEAIGAYERGSLLKRHCETKLYEAKMRIEKIALEPKTAGMQEPIEI